MTGEVALGGGGGQNDSNGNTWSLGAGGIDAPVLMNGNPAGHFAKLIYVNGAIVYLQKSDGGWWGFVPNSQMLVPIPNTYPTQLPTATPAFLGYP